MTIIKEYDATISQEGYDSALTELDRIRKMYGPRTDLAIAIWGSASTSADMRNLITVALESGALKVTGDNQRVISDALFTPKQGASSIDYDTVTWSPFSNPF